MWVDHIFCFQLTSQSAMASNGHPSDAIFKKFPGVSKDVLTVKETLAVQKAIGKVKSRILYIARALSLPSDRIEEIERVHKDDNRRALAVIATWLQGNFNDSRMPYSVHPEKKYRCPSWWNLVWAIAHRSGGNDPAHAVKIAGEYKNFQKESSAPPQSFQHVSIEQFEEDMAAEIGDKLYAVWIKWYEIGVGLKLSATTLDNLAGNTPEDKMLGVITSWIREGITEDPPPCWQRLLEVVDAPYGGQNPALALELAKQHSTKKEGEEDGQQKDEVMEVDQPKSEGPSSTTMDETGQAQTAGVSEDSAIPQISTISDPQPDIPLANIVDDSAGRPASPNDFIVYSRRSHKPNSQKQPHGLALVISNEKFDQSARLSQRICAPYDDQRLNKILTALGYRVVIRKNQTGREMNVLFDTIRSNSPGELHIHNEDDSFICVISSHGDWDPVKNTDFIYGRDRDRLYLQEAVYDKLNAMVSPHLKGKPKLFFIQACRGVGYGRIADDGGTEVQLPPQLPRESDFFISYSTAPETKSFRYDPNRPQPEGEPIDITGDENSNSYIIGSFYITELCLALKRFAQKLDLMNIVLSVHQTLQATDKNLFHLGSKTTRQCPHMTLSLRGPVFFYDDAEALFKEYMKKCLK